VKRLDNDWYTTRVRAELVKLLARLARLLVIRPHTLGRERRIPDRGYGQRDWPTPKLKTVMAFGFLKKITPAPERDLEPTIVLVSTDPQVCNAVRLAMPSAWRLRETGRVEDARREIAARGAALAVLDRDLPGMQWRRSIRELASPPQTACVIVLSTTADSNVWEQVGAAGAYEVLSKPVVPDRLADVLQAAWKFWRSQRALHDDARANG